MPKAECWDCHKTFTDTDIYGLMMQMITHYLNSYSYIPALNSGYHKCGSFFIDGKTTHTICFGNKRWEEYVDGDLQSSGKIPK